MMEVTCLSSLVSRHNYYLPILQLALVTYWVVWCFPLSWAWRQCTEVWGSELSGLQLSLSPLENDVKANYYQFYATHQLSYSYKNFKSEIEAPIAWTPYSFESGKTTRLHRFPLSAYQAGTAGNDTIEALCYSTLS